MKTQDFSRLAAPLLLTCLAAADLIKLYSADESAPPLVLAVRSLLIWCSLGLLIWFKRRTPKPKGGGALASVAWVLLGTATLLSGLLHGDATGIATGLWQILALPLVFGRILPRVLGKQGLGLVAGALACSATGYLLVSLVSTPFSLPYRGMTSNPNSIGMIAAGGFAGCTACWVAQAGRSFWRGVLLTSGMLLNALLAGAAGSRTSCIACGIMLALIALPAFFRSLHRPLKLAGALLVCTAVAAGVWAAFSEQITLAYLLMTLKSENYSALNGRDEIWSQVWREQSLFGHGPAYWEQQVGIGAHNSIVGVLGTFGSLAAICCMLLAVTTLYTAGVYYWRTRRVNPHALTPLLITACFWTLSSAEGMLGILGGATNLAFFLVTGIVGAQPGIGTRFAFRPFQPRAISQPVPQSA